MLRALAGAGRTGVRAAGRGRGPAAARRLAAPATALARRAAPGEGRRPLSAEAEAERRPIDSTPTGKVGDGFHRASVKAERRLAKRKQQILENRRGAREAEEEGGDFAELARVESDARLKPLATRMAPTSDFLPSLLRLAASPRTRVRFTAAKMLGALPIARAEYRTTVMAAVGAVRAGEGGDELLSRAVDAVEGLHESKGFDPANSTLLRELERSKAAPPGSAKA